VTWSSKKLTILLSLLAGVNNGVEVGMLQASRPFS
jgi:hypothetical protein